MRKIFLVGLIVLSTIPMPALAQDQLKQAVEKLAHEYSAAYNNHNADAVAALFTADGIFVAVDGRIYHGRGEIKAYNQQVFDRGAKDHAVAVSEVHPIGEAVYALGSVSFSMPGKDGASMKLAGSWTAIDVSDGGQWRTKLLFASAPPARPAMN